MPARFPVIDLFAGPGGLSEGFAACQDFRVGLSIEKDPTAHQTLELRAFFRQFDRPDVPGEYYDHLRDPQALTRSQLFDAFPRQAHAARQEAWQAELGVTPHDQVEQRIRDALSREKSWVLIGGPPCQAYSLVGRSRRGGMDGQLGSLRVQ